MTPEKALEDLFQLADQLSATGQVHRHIALCVSTLREALKPVEKVRGA